MPDTVHEEILKWANDRPGWQRDALRRLFTTGKITPVDVDDLVDLCKASHGLSAARKPVVLGHEHLAVRDESMDPVALVSVTHHRGVNALAPDQTITFGPSLTLVYGPNAAGKSGYIRILKRACRSRFSEEILSNVLSGEKPLKAAVTIRMRRGATERSFQWTPDTAPSTDLAAVSVFDAHCAPVYLREKTDVAFRPFDLDVFDRLSAACNDVRRRLEMEQAQLSTAPANLPKVPEGTRAKSLLDSLTSLTSMDDVRKLAQLSKDEEGRLKALGDQKRDLQASDPRQRARELTLKAGRMELIERHVASLATALGNEALSGFSTAAQSLRAGREVLALLRRTAVTPDLLPGTGEDAWRTMWEAAGVFSNLAYPELSFPVVADDARCPLCQQTIAHEAAERLRHLQEYFESTAQAQVLAAERNYNAALNALTQVVVEREDVRVAVAELNADDTDLAERVREFLQEAKRIQDDTTAAVGNGGQIPTSGLKSGPEPKLRSAAGSLRDRATQLQKQLPAMDAKALAELEDLESRMVLGEHLQVIQTEIERKKRLAAYRESIEDTDTHGITRKSTELTKRLVTDQLRSTFKTELAKVDFTHLAVEIRPAGGTKGALFHHLTFSTAPGVAMTDVLSEGESRTLSLAAFLAELSTAPSPSAIIFDDPVSSLDHSWRGRIAVRLVHEAKTRQVIVFTHDIVFLRFLLDECAKEGVAHHPQYVRRDPQAGVCSADLPWIAMGIRDRLGALKNRWQAADKLHRTAGHETYESAAREMYALLREAWEQGVSEVLLNDVVARYRHSIETQKVRVLYDITEEDCTTVDAAMSECSRWMRGHDAPSADGTPFPQPNELQKRIQELDDWVKKIRARRK